MKKSKVKSKKFSVLRFALSFFLFPFSFFLFRAVSAQQPLITALEWEAETYVPSGYPAKALAARGGMLRVAVIPAAGVKEEDFVAEWRVDDKIALGATPFAIRFVVAQEPGFAHTVRLHAKHRRNNAVEEATLLIPVVAPEVTLHRVTQDRMPSPYVTERTIALAGGAPSSLAAKAYYFPGGAPRVGWSSNGQLLAGAPRQAQFLNITAPANLAEPISQRVQAIARDPRFSEIVAIREVSIEIR